MVCPGEEPGLYLDSPGPKALLPHALYTLLVLCSGAIYLVLCVAVKVSFLCSFSRTSQPNFTHSCFVQNILLETKEGGLH